MSPQSKDRGKTSPAVMCIKILLHIFNLIYTIIGICVLATGIWVQIQLKNYIALTNLYYANTAYIMIGVGILIMLVAIGGFYCTAKDKIALLYMYGIFILLLAVMQIGAGIAGGVKSKSLDSQIGEGLHDSIKDHTSNMKYWDEVQKNLKCCGVNNATDWKNYGGIPGSCYKGGSTPSPTKAPVTAPSANTTQSETTRTAEPTTTKKPEATTTAELTTTKKPGPTEPTTTKKPGPTEPTTTKKPGPTEPTTTKKPGPTEPTPKSTTTEVTTANNPSDVEEVSKAATDKASTPAKDATTTPTTPAKETITAPTTPAAPGEKSRKRRSADGLYDTGCYAKIKDKMSQYLSLIIGVCVGFVVLQVLGAVLACCLARKTSRNNYEQIY